MKTPGTFDDVWPFVPVGKLTAAERGLYYDDLNAYLKLVEPQVAGFFGGGNSDFWESQHFRVGFMDDSNGTIVNADGFRGKPLGSPKLHVFMSRFFAGALPGKHFKLQLFLGSQSQFDGGQMEMVGHSYAVDGVLGDYVNLSNEPVFRNVTVDQLLKLRLGVNFVVNKDSEKPIGLLKSDVLKRGIELSRSYNPVFGAALTYIQGLTTSILGAKGNQAIISHDLTFTSKPSPTAPTLCEGTYVFVQVPKGSLNHFEWTKFHWDAQQSRVLVGATPLGWNHLILIIQAAT